jgi:hypothetical protein
MLRASAGQSARVAVTGPDDELAAETLFDALARLEGKRLDGFHLAHTGRHGYEEKLQVAVARAGAQFAYVLHAERSGTTITR